MQEQNETQELNRVGLTVQREARCTNDLLGFSDEKLLKLAATGAFLNVKAIQVDFNDCFNALIVGERHTKEKLIWNPLLDDGDALRLAILMRLDINFNFNQAFVWRADMEEDAAIVGFGDDSSVATRRAIVLAAAQIGRAKT